MNAIRPYSSVQQTTRKAVVMWLLLLAVAADQARAQILPPALSSPANGSTGQPTSLVLDWYASFGAIEYRVQVAANPGFSSPILDSSGVVETSTAIGGLAGNTRYYWRVRASTLAFTSEWSSVWNFTTIVSPPPPPPTPVLLSPPDGATGQPSSPTLSWNASSNAERYHLQVSTSPAFGTLVMEDTSITGTSRQIGSLSAGTQYFWRVRAANAAGTSGWSAVWSLTTAALPPVPPGLISPANGATSQPLTPVLTWNASAGADRYHVQVSTSSAFGTLVVNDSSITGTSFQIGPLAQTTQYYWRVRGTNSGGAGDWSTVWGFTTESGVTPPEPPALALPPNGATNQPGSLTVSWNASPGADRYHLQVTTSPTFGTLVVEDTSITGTSRLIGSLSAGTQYFWRARAANAAGTSSWSAVWSFTTAALPPLPPGLIAPPNGATNQPLTPVLTWNASAGADRYHLQVSTSSSFGTLVVDDSSFTGTSFQIGPLAQATQYYWRARGMNSGGAGDWSAVWGFTTESSSVTPPEPPVLASPPNGATNQPSTVTLAWNASTGADKYHLQVSTSPAFETLVVSDTTITGVSRQVGPLVSRVQYYWRARAGNAGGVSGWSPVWSFVTIATPPPAPALVLPANGAVDQPLTLTLSWNTSPGAERYRLQMSTSSSFSTLEVDDSSITGTSRVTGPLNPGTQYYWRVRGMNSGGAGSWSAVWVFLTGSAGVTPPEVPVLVLPPHGATGLPITLLVAWYPAVRASTYHVQVSTDAGFATLTFDMNDVQDTTVQIGPLAEGGTYYWRARAGNSAGNSSWSSARTFSTEPPSGIVPPDLVAPSNGAVNQPTTLTLRWSTATGASSYHVQVAADPGFSSRVVDQSGIASTQHTVSGLTTGATYYWRVRGMTIVISSPWSDVWTFTTGTSLPPAPTLLAPANGASNQQGSVTMMWNALAGAIRYQVDIGMNSSLTPAVLSDSTLQAASYPFTAIPDTIYYWRVRARTTGGWGPYSPIWSFSTAPSTVTINATFEFPDRGSASEYTAADYKIMGLPGASNAAIPALLPGTPGEDWDLYRDNGLPSNYLELFNGDPGFRFSMGKGFWLIKRGPWSVSHTAPAAPLNARAEAEIPLQAGWNLITCPFTSSVDWSLVQSVNVISDPLYAFDGAFAVATRLEPYRGYYFFNTTGRTVLCVPAPGSVSPPTIAQHGEPADGWRVAVSLNVGPQRDQVAWFGCSTAASDGLDPLDWRKPRGVSSDAELCFDRPSWDSLYHVFASDIRSSVGDGSVWTFSVRSSRDRRQPVRLTFHGVDQVPSGYSVYLIDDNRFAHADLRADSLYEAMPFATNADFRVVVGTDEYVQQVLSTIPIPREFVLESNYPNPFNPRTSFPLVVPRDGELEVSVFDILGRRVKVLFTGSLASGRYPLVWDGTDDRGHSAASGLYFVRLTTKDGVHAVRRMMFMK